MEKEIQLAFELFEHPKKMSAEDISEILIGTADALKFISQEITRSQDELNNWKVLYLSMNSPFHAVFSPSEQCPLDTSLEARSIFFSGQELISKSHKIPEAFSKDAIESLNRVYAARKRTGKSARFMYDEYELVSNTTLENNLSVLLQSLTSFEHYEWTTLTGKLQELSGKTQSGKKNPYFTLKPNLFSASVKCYFDDDENDFQKIHDNLKLNPIDISVFGKVKFNVKGQPLQVTEIKSYRIIPKVDSILKKRSEIDLNLTNGVNSVDYIKQVRNEI